MRPPQRYKFITERKRVRTTNAIERRFREVCRRTRPMRVFSDRTSMDRILFAVFNHENRNQGVSNHTPGRVPPGGVGAVGK